jgi:hypothetical protein
MGDGTKVHGRTESSMGLGRLLQRPGWRSRGSGAVVDAYVGSVRPKSSKTTDPVSPTTIHKLSVL